MTTDSHPVTAGAAVLVRIPRPKFAPRRLVRSKLRAAVPDYRQLPGLVRKAFTLEVETGDFGGVYLWSTRSDAESWFSDEWFTRVRDERGVEPIVDYVDLDIRVSSTSDGEVRSATLIEFRSELAADDAAIDRLWGEANDCVAQDAIVAAGRGTNERLQPCFVMWWAGTVPDVDREVERWQQLATGMEGASVTRFEAAASLSNTGGVGSVAR